MQESSGQKSIEGEDGIWAWDVLEKRKGIHNDSNEKHSRRSSSCSSSSSSRSSSLSQEYSTRHNSRSPLNRERKTRRRCSDDTDRSDSEERTRRGIPNRSKMNVSNKTTRKFRKHSSSKSPSRSPSCEESSLERKNVKRSKCARSRSPSNDKNIEKIEVNQKLIKSSGENILDTSFRENRSKERSCSIDPKGDKFDVAEHSYRKREAVPGSHVNNKDKEPNSRDKRKGDKVKARSRSKSKDKKLRLHKSRSRSCSVGRRSRSRSKGRSSRIRRANSPRRRSRSHSRGHYYRRKSSPRRRRSRSRERRSRSRGRCRRSRSRDKHSSRYHHYRSTSRDRYRSHRYSRSRSRSRSHSRLSSREKTKDIGSSSNKLVSLPLPISTGAMTPQMALQQAMAQMSAKAQALTGIALPTYYNPAAVNPLKYAEQVQKRKKLWEKEKTEEQNKGTVWDKMTFAQDQDGRMTAKFRKLMGIKGEENAEQPPDENLVKDEDVVKKQEELFRNLDQQYEMARMSTHTHRGVGLGYTSQAIYPPIQK